MNEEATATTISVVDGTVPMIRVKVRGHLTDTVLRECSASVRALPEFDTGTPALIDLTGITTVEATTQAIVALAEAAQKDRNRVAILSTNLSVFALARMYEIVADHTERRVQVFTEEPLALEWLLD